MNTNNIIEILNNNIRIKEIIEFEKKLEELKKEIEQVKDDKDIMSLKRLLDTEMQCKIDHRSLKDKLSKEEKELYKAIVVYLKYSDYTEEIRKIEKISKKSSNLVETVNSEGRKKKIDKDFIEHYNIIVAKKNEISKDYIKAFNKLEEYKGLTNLEPELREEKEEIRLATNVESEELKNTVNEEKNKEHDIDSSSKIEKSNKGKVRKFVTGFALGVAAFASLLSFGNSKNSQTKDNVKVEKELKNEEEEIKVNRITGENNNNENDKDRVITHSFIEDTDKADYSITIGDNLTVSNSSKIMMDEYEATFYENGKIPYYNSDEYRVVEAVVYQMPTGEIIVARNEEEVNYCESVNGRNITAYLSSSKYGIEGFYSSKDVIINDDNISRKRVK